MPDPKVDTERVFHALGDPTRRAMLDRLCKGPSSASRLAVQLGITVTAVGQHLHVLEESHLVHSEKVGRVRTCRVDDAGFAILEQWILDRRSMWDQRLDRLGELIASSQEHPLKNLENDVQIPVTSSDKGV